MNIYLNRNFLAAIKEGNTDKNTEKGGGFTKKIKYMWMPYLNNILDNESCQTHRNKC